ncbi:hypothetical protein D3C78_1732950 [compost metagenome]
MRFGFALGRINHHLGRWNSIDALGDGLTLGFFCQVDRLAVLDLIQIALHDELAIGAGIQYATALKLDFVQAVQWA